MKTKKTMTAVGGLLLLSLARFASAQVNVLSAPTADSFALASNKNVASVEACMKAPPSVVERAIAIYQGDANKAGGAAGESTPGENRVLVGVVGDEVTDQLIGAAKLDVSALKGKWETYLIAVVNDPKPGVKRGLVVIGSDPRGAAFGLMDLSERIGVSPWSWWADVPVARRDAIHIQIGAPVIDGPKVKYRGIFINDEDWSLHQWAKNTYEPENKSVGPKTYAKVFELLLRLKANTLWPAMHGVTTSFNTFRENPALAASYGIVMGSSHCEPLLTNNEKEWNREKPWNWETNREGILAFLQHRVTENAAFDSLWTVGMRGIHDSPLGGGGDLDAKTRRMEEIIKAERDMLAPVGHGDVTKVPQVFIPYKEVLEIYNNGVRVPEDVTLMWVDDNHGWIRRLSNETERKRSGGSGVYYHLSYWGRPISYLWLDTIPPAQVWAEMTKAAAYGADRVWVVNVGDIKHTEKGMDYFLRLAWNPADPKLADQAAWLKSFAAKNFGDALAGEIGDVLNEFYRLSWGHKPEQFGGNTPDSPMWDPAIASARMEACDALYARALAIEAKLPAEMRDAYFELVLYPVSGMTATTVKVLSARESRRVVTQDATTADQAADRSDAAWARVLADTRRYNETVADGKWRRIADNRPLPGSDPQNSSLNEPMVSRRDNTVRAAVPKIPVGPEKHLALKDATFTAGSGGATFRVLGGLGTDEQVAVVEPRLITEAIDEAKSPRAEWQFDAATEGEVRLVINALPVHHPSGLASDGGVRCAIRVNGGPLQPVEFSYAHDGQEWGNRVVAARMSQSINLTLKAGRQVVTVYAMGSDLVLDSVDVFKP